MGLEVMDSWGRGRKGEGGGVSIKAKGEASQSTRKYLQQKHTQYNMSGVGVAVGRHRASLGLWKRHPGQSQHIPKEWVWGPPHVHHDVEGGGRVDDPFASAAARHEGADRRLHHHHVAHLQLPVLPALHIRMHLKCRCYGIAMYVPTIATVPPPQCKALCSLQSPPPPRILRS